MLNTEFNSWLHGYFSLVQPRVKELTALQNDIIRSHIKLTQEVCGGFLSITNSCILEALDPTDIHKPSSLNTHLVAFIHTIANDFQAKPILTGNEVAYFMQGFFEIGEESQTSFWSREQCRTVMQVMNRNVDGLHPVLLQVYWKIRRFLATDEQTLATSDIKRDINGLFEHVIDQSYGFSDTKQAELQSIHDSYKS